MVKKAAADKNTAEKKDRAARQLEAWKNSVSEKTDALIEDLEDSLNISNYYNTGMYTNIHNYVEAGY
jgi:hypothetical protein